MFHERLLFKGYNKRWIWFTMWNVSSYHFQSFLFFVSFFWAVFHRSLLPNIEVGALWPPTGVERFSPFQAPLLNASILLASGFAVTWAHHALIENNFDQCLQGLLITVILGLYFSFHQGLEYMKAYFTIADRIYGSTFYLATGFNWLHVLIGTIFLQSISYVMLSFIFHHNITSDLKMQLGIDTSLTLCG